MTGKQLKKQRTERHMTQKDLAEALGVRWNTVWRWENGYHPIPAWVDKLLSLLWQGKQK